MLGPAGCGAGPDDWLGMGGLSEAGAVTGLVFADSGLLGGDPLPWLVLAVGGALAIGTTLALVRAHGDPDAGELERPPMARSLVMIGVGLLAAVWALASLVKG